MQTDLTDAFQPLDPSPQAVAEDSLPLEPATWASVPPALRLTQSDGSLDMLHLNVDFPYGDMAHSFRLLGPVEPFNLQLITKQAHCIALQ